jgi:amino acid transporter
MNATLGLYKLDLGFMNFGDSAHVLGETFALFLLILILHALINIFSSPLVALFNNISVFWHVVGVAVLIALLIFVPDNHASADFVFTERLNNTGLFGGSTSSLAFFIYVIPLGVLLTMYTQTGYDASAHISEETKGAAKGAAQGVWRSVFYSGLIGWFVLLAITFAASDTKFINDAGNGYGIGSSIAIIVHALDNHVWAAKAVLLIATIGQLFCGMACLTSASRMCYAFSRDRAVPGHQIWTRLNHHRVPAFSVIFMAAFAGIVTLPALIGDENNYTYAFFAVVSITVIGLYIAYVIPVWLRFRKGDSWQPGPWTLGKKYKWMNPAAVLWVAICVIVFSLPQGSTGMPGNKDFDFKYVNYAPITVLVVIGAVGLWWLLSARHHFTGPIRQIKMDDTGRVIQDEEKLEDKPAT